MLSGAGMGGWRAGGVQIAPQEKIGGAAPPTIEPLEKNGGAALPTVETWRCHRHRQHRLGGVVVPVGLAHVSDPKMVF